MKAPHTINAQYLSELATKIQTLPPDEASVILLELSTLVLMAGFPDIAYQGFLSLTQGELKLSESSSLVDSVKEALLALCYLQRRPCPAIFSNEDMSLAQLEQYMQETMKQYELLPANEFNEYYQKLLEEELKGPMMELQETFSELQSQIAEINQESDGLDNENLNVSEEFAGNSESDDGLYDDQLKIILEIQQSLKQNNISRADQQIHRLWRYFTQNNLHQRSRASVSIASHWPKMMQRVANGVLNSEISISEQQAQDFLKAVETRHYDAQCQSFAPSEEDWRNFLQQWNDKIFQYFENEPDEAEHIKAEYPEAFERRSLLSPGATNAEITELESQLKTKLPLSYKNFLLASNGFNIASNYRTFYGTHDGIRWFIDENEDWIEDWEEDDDNVNDETYFQYGEHQDCCNIRARYMRTALQISDDDEGDVFLLNQEIIDSRNEWEAWDFGVKNSGAYRYRSFWGMAQTLYDQCGEW